MIERVVTADHRRLSASPSLLQTRALTARRVWDNAIVLMADAAALALAVLLAPADPVFVSIALAARLVIGWARADHVQPRLSISLGREAVRAIQLASPALVIACAASAAEIGHRSWPAFALTLLALTVAARVSAAQLLSVVRRRGRRLRQTVVACGTDRKLAERITETIGAHPECGLVVVGHVGQGLHTGVAGIDLRTILDLAAGDVCVVVATHDPIDPRLGKLIEEAPGVETFLVLRPLEATVCAPSRLDHIWAQPVGWVPARAKRLPTMAVKRMLDAVGAMTILVVATPVLVAIAIGVRLSSPGPVVFRQRRLGWHGKQFELLKFRTMYLNSDSDSLWSPAGDDRVTPIGRFLRRTGLDELPQLFNILRGDMSLVGPRPERPHFARQFADEVPSYSRRFRLPGGLTGLAQVEDLRGDTSIADRARFDNRYIDHWSVAGDLAIIARTARTVFRRGSH